MDKDSLNSKELKQEIFVIGAGVWGVALAHQLAKKNKVIVWDRNKKLINHLNNNRCHPAFKNHQFHSNIQFSEQIIDAENVLIAVSSSGFMDVLGQIKQAQLKSVAIATKGILSKEPHFLPKFFDSFRNENHLNHQVGSAVMLSGPTFATEVLADFPTGISVASDSQEQAKKWANFLHYGYFRPYINDDPLAMNIFGALKNIYAIVCGIASGMGFGANTQSLLINRSLNEMNDFAVFFGSKKSSSFALGAMGDLILTSTDNQSRNRSFGYSIGEGKTVNQAQKELGKLVEGMNCLVTAYDLMKKFGLKLPILSALYNVIEKQQPPHLVIDQLFSRKLKKD